MPSTYVLQNKERYTDLSITGLSNFLPQDIMLLECLIDFMEKRDYFQEHFATERVYHIA
jgi:hypothetical protein